MIKHDIPKHIGNCASIKTLLQYQQGSLSEAQRTKISTHLPTCELCQYALDTAISIDPAEMEEDLPILKKKIQEKLFEQKRKRRQPYLSKIAASLLFLLSFGIATYLFINTNSTNNLYEQYYQAYEIPETLLKSTTTNIPPISAPLAKAIAAYKNIPYQTTPSDLPSSFEQNAYETSFTQLLNALTSLEKGELSNAIQQLEKVQKSKTKFAKDADWYLALAHLRNNSIAEAIPYLDQIILRKDELYYEKAKTLKMKLDK